ncbi:helix-turn-helix domain-containing protein [Consotaella salsifontis]|uniref:Transcriptional regulator, contains XRE-family HTH domain n=1 Tax=Consotaella salsifontis TaxID=1365950 RepID=A0A1T4P8F9_9HYPH|nr:helix-turn-helix transcriptional regulator [Consotaella salsifontis]SJZ87784.1 Transcriptional regulator, contains XRE-family HTH domain [Consotaella salsifontis]
MSIELEIDRHVGRQLQQVRRRKKVSQTELGNAIGVTFQQVQKYEKGINRISASKLVLISNFLQIPIAYFFENCPGLDDEESARPVVVFREPQQIANLAPDVRSAFLTLAEAVHRARR